MTSIFRYKGVIYASKRQLLDDLCNTGPLAYTKTTDFRLFSKPIIIAIKQHMSLSVHEDEYVIGIGDRLIIYVFTRAAKKSAIAFRSYLDTPGLLSVKKTPKPQPA